MGIAGLCLLSERDSERTPAYGGGSFLFQRVQHY